MIMEPDFTSKPPPGYAEQVRERGISGPNGVTALSSARGLESCTSSSCGIGLEESKFAVCAVPVLWELPR